MNDQTSSKTESDESLLSIEAYVKSRNDYSVMLAIDEVVLSGIPYDEQTAKITSLINNVADESGGVES